MLPAQCWLVPDFPPRLFAIVPLYEISKAPLYHIHTLTIAIAYVLVSKSRRGLSLSVLRVFSTAVIPILNSIRNSIPIPSHRPRSWRNRVSFCGFSTSMIPFVFLPFHFSFSPFRCVHITRSINFSTRTKKKLRATTGCHADFSNVPFVFHPLRRARYVRRPAGGGKQGRELMQLNWTKCNVARDFA